MLSSFGKARGLEGFGFLGCDLVLTRCSAVPLWVELLAADGTKGRWNFEGGSASTLWVSLPQAVNFGCFKSSPELRPSPNFGLHATAFGTGRVCSLIAGACVGIGHALAMDPTTGGQATPRSSVPDTPQPVVGVGGCPPIGDVCQDPAELE